MSNEKKQPEGRSDDEIEHTMAGTRVVLQKCILIPFRRLDETWPCLVSWGVVQTGCITAKPCSCVQPSGKRRRTIINFWSGNPYYLPISPAHASGVALRLMTSAYMWFSDSWRMSFMTLCSQQCPQLGDVSQDLWV